MTSRERQIQMLRNTPGFIQSVRAAYKIASDFRKDDGWILFRFVTLIESTSVVTLLEQYHGKLLITLFGVKFKAEELGFYDDEVVEPDSKKPIEPPIIEQQITNPHNTFWVKNPNGRLCQSIYKQPPNIIEDDKLYRYLINHARPVGVLFESEIPQRMRDLIERLPEARLFILLNDGMIGILRSDGLVHNY